MTSAAILEWSDILSTGLPEIDSQHRRLVDILNEIGRLHYRGAAADELISILDELRSYSVYHFQSEADLMQCYPVDQIQKRLHLEMHQGFIKRISKIRELIDTDPVVVDHLLAFVVKWLVHHVTGVDARMAQEIMTLRAAGPDVDIRREGNLFNDSLINIVSELYDSLGTRSFELLEVNRRLQIEIGRRQLVETVLSDSELRFRRLYNFAPVALCEENWSEAKRALVQLHESGIDDVPAYLHQHPDETSRLVGMVKIQDVNETALRQIGAASKEELLAGRDPFFNVASLPGFADKLMALAQGRLSYEGECSFVSRDKTRHTIALNLFVMPDHEQTLEVVIVSWQDITERHQMQVELHASEERFRATFNQAAVGLAHVGINGLCMRANKKMCDIIGYTEAELQKLTFVDITHPDDVYLFRENSRCLRNGEINDFSLESRCVRKDGSAIWAEVSVSLVCDARGLPHYFITAFNDISRRKDMEKELRHLAYHDALTNLPNRMLLQDRLSQSIVYANRSGRHVAVMMIDVDRFKNINDSLGHDIGDKVILEIGHRLSRNTRDGDTVARLGGDEFVVILADVAREGDVAMLARQALQSIAQPLVMPGQELYPSGSIGISLYPKDGEDGKSLLQNADAAMYRVKRCGGNNFQFYAHEMNAHTLERLRIESELRSALEREEFILHYQPKVDLNDGRIIGMEALIRWNHPQSGMVSPASFIGIAEETGLIVPIGAWVLRTACLQNKAWQNAGLCCFRVAVNLSARQFYQQDLVQSIAAILDETGHDPHYLEIELTESLVMTDIEDAVDILCKLKALGVKLSIDDFGTGYSSLSYLRRFPIDALKIDQSFVRDITTDQDNAVIAASIISLAHSLKLQVIAEGVETESQVEYLRRHRCDQMQGYYFSRPLPAKEFEQMLRRIKS